MFFVDLIRIRVVSSLLLSVQDAVVLISFRKCVIYAAWQWFSSSCGNLSSVVCGGLAPGSVYDMWWHTMFTRDACLGMVFFPIFHTPIRRLS